MDDGEFEGPLFKRLSRNDSGLGVGHQAGFVIPVELRPFFPELPAPTDAQPAPSVPLRAILQYDDGAPQSANTSWQYQSWGNTRAPESRITGNLEPARGPSLPGDLLLIERSIDDGLLFRLTVISQTGPLFALVQPRTGGRRWGLLAGGTIPVPESEVDDALAAMEQRQATPFDPFDASLVYQPATKRIARSRAFRKAVIAAYGGRCAMCGGGATAPDGRSEIEAAHVIPRGMAGADDVRNGLALCRLHHWAFDNMLLGVSAGRMIVCPPHVAAIAGNAALAQLDGAPLIAPEDDELAVDDFAIGWAYERFDAAWTSTIS
jgi:putative restriction endonuclease